MLRFYSLFSIKSVIGLFAAMLALSACNDAAEPVAQPSAPVLEVVSPEPEHHSTSSSEFAARLPLDAPVIMAATEANGPPFEFLDKQGKIIGFDIDIIHAIASDQGIRVNVINTKWDTIFVGLDGNEYDIVFGGMGTTPERQAKYVLTDSYVESPSRIVVLEDSPIKQLSDLNGKNIGVTLGYDATADLKEHKITATQQESDSIYAQVKDLVSGKTDAMIADGLVAAYHINHIPDQKFRFIDFANVTIPNVVMASHNKELVEKLNAGLANIKANGTYDVIYTKWFGESAKK